MNSRIWKEGIGWIFDNQTKVRKAILDGTLILPTSKTVNPYPDMKTYVPEDYYDKPYEVTLAVNAPGIRYYLCSGIS
jgi:hypothetical protein